jgi:hypothetical protein
MVASILRIETAVRSCIAFGVSLGGTVSCDWVAELVLARHFVSSGMSCVWVVKKARNVLTVQVTIIFTKGNVFRLSDMLFNDVVSSA